ncbi:MAG: hypothetical protein WED34_18735 [Planctomycetales bacterium]
MPTQLASTHSPTTSTVALRPAEPDDAERGLLDVLDQLSAAGVGGLPRPELFASDGLHLSGMGYAVWAERVGPHLGRPVQAPAPRPSEGVD